MLLRHNRWFGALVIFFLIFLFSIYGQKSQAQKLSHNGEEIFVVGANLPWNNFGWDFGVHPNWGIGFEESFFEESFEKLSESGINTVRIWMHTDGRANPVFDNQGFVTGLSADHLDQVDQVLDMAAAHDLLVIFVLWSHDMVMDSRAIAGPFAGKHESLIIDQNKTQSYIDNALLPLVSAVDEHCNFLAWEIISEPEWMMDIRGGGKYAKLDPNVVIRFVGDLILAIKSSSDQKVTVGSAWPDKLTIQREHVYFHDLNFQELGFHCEQVFQDFYSFHFFEWMNKSSSPFVKDFSEWSVEKPMLITETPAKQLNDKHGNFDVFEQLSKAYENDYAGLMYWSLNALDDKGDLEPELSDIENFAFQMNPTELLPQLDCNADLESDPSFICRPWPNPIVEELHFYFDYLEERKVELELFDFTTGALIFQQDISESVNYDKTFTLKVSQISNAGFVLAKVRSTTEKTSTEYRFKLLKL